MRLSVNFNEEEFKCPCCGKVEMQRVFVGKLQKARDIADIPFVITSGYRCVKHNKEVGGSENSEHLFGLAADIACTDSRSRYKIITALLKAGFIRIGIGKNFIHAGDGYKIGQVIWIY